jgi:hypothetical protein
LGTGSTISGRRSPSEGGFVPAKAVHVNTSRTNRVVKFLDSLFMADFLLLKIVPGMLFSEPCRALRSSEPQMEAMGIVA